MVQALAQFSDPTLQCATYSEEAWQPQPARVLEDLGQSVHGGRVGRVDGFEGEDSAPRSLGGEPVARFDELSVQGWPGHVTPKPLAESWLERGTPWLRSGQLLAEEVRHRAAGSIQDSPTGAERIATHMEYLQVMRRWWECVRTDYDCVPPCTAPLPHRLPALLRHCVPPCHLHRCLLLHPLHCMKLTGCAHRHLASLDQFSELPPDLAASHSDSTISKRCARESPRNSTGPFLDAEAMFLALPGFVSWLPTRVWCSTTGHLPDKLNGI